MNRGNKGPVVILYFVILVILLLSNFVFSHLIKYPVFSFVMLCDLSGTSLDVDDIKIPTDEALYICGNLDYQQEVEIDARLYENIDDIRNFELQNETVSPGNFQFALFPNFKWNQKIYYVTIYYGRHYVLPPTVLDFSQ